MKRILFSLLIGTLVSANTAQAQRYLQEVFPMADITTNIAYGAANTWDNQNQNLALDVYRPLGDTATLRPLIIFFHGGSFVSGVRNDGVMTSLCNTFAKRGYVTATASYRLGVNAANITSLDREFVKAALRATHDAKAAVRFFKRSVAEQQNPYGIDTTRIYIGGYSAGAIAAIHVAWFTDTTLSTGIVNQELVTLGAGLEGNSGNPGYTSAVAGVFNIAGAVLDTAIMASGAVTGIHFHGTADDVVPYGRGFVRAGGFPVLTVDGSSLIHNRLQNLGTYSELLTYSAGHDLVANSSISADIISNGARFFFNLQNNSVSVAEQPQLLAQLYPNPSRGWLQVQTSATAPCQIAVYNLQGAKVLQTAVHEGEKIDLTHLPAGMYLAHLQQGGATKIQKIILQP